MKANANHSAGKSPVNHSAGKTQRNINFIVSFYRPSLVCCSDSSGLQSSDVKIIKLAKYMHEILHTCRISNIFVRKYFIRRIEHELLKENVFNAGKKQLFLQ